MEVGFGFGNFPFPGKTGLGALSSHISLDSPRSKRVIVHQRDVYEKSRGSGRGLLVNKCTETVNLRESS